MTTDSKMFSFMGIRMDFGAAIHRLRLRCGTKVAHTERYNCKIKGVCSISQTIIG